MNGFLQPTVEIYTLQTVSFYDVFNAMLCLQRLNTLLAELSSIKEGRALCCFRTNEAMWELFLHQAPGIRWLVLRLNGKPFGHCESTVMQELSVSCRFTKTKFPTTKHCHRRSCCKYLL